MDLGKGDEGAASSPAVKRRVAFSGASVCFCWLPWVFLVVSLGNYFFRVIWICQLVWPACSFMGAGKCQLKRKSGEPCDSAAQAERIESRRPKAALHPFNVSNACAHWRIDLVCDGRAKE